VAGYRLERQIGTGGMAVVYLARDERLGRPVALKVMTPAMAADDRFRQRFIQESRAAATVDDPHIIPVYEAGEADGVLFIAIRFVSGGDVGSMLRRAGPLPPARVVHIVSAVASALDAAHAAGLVHRDVKPANMLLDSRPGWPDHVYLSDFGLSKVRQSGRLTGSGHFMGTPHYTAPEQITGQTVDGRADQYALACATYEMLCGEVPFADQEGWAVVSAQVNNAPPALTASRPDLPRAINDVLARAMAKTAEARYQSCRQFAEALRDGLGLVSPEAGPVSTPAAARPATPDPQATAAPAPPKRTGTGRRRRPPRHRRYVPIVLPATAVLAAAAVTIAVLVPAGGHPRAALYSRIRAFTAPRPAGIWPFVSSVAFSPGGQTLATGLTTETSAGPDNSGATYLWNVRTGRRLATITSAGGPEAFSPDGATLAAAGGLGDQRLSRWDTATRTLARGPDDNQDAAIDSAVFSPNGKLLATALSSGVIDLWNSATWKSLRLIGGPGLSVSTAVAFTPDGRTLVTGEDTDRVFLWNWATGHLISQLKCPGNLQITAVAVSGNGATIAASDQNGGTCLWDTSSRRRSAVLTDPHSYGVDSVAFSPDGKMLATGDSNGHVYLWKLPAGTLTARLTNPRGQVTSGLEGEERTAVSSIAFSPGGDTLAASDTNGSAYLWRVR
jgi:serine/threonine-protein kinase